MFRRRFYLSGESRFPLARIDRTGEPLRHPVRLRRLESEFNIPLANDHQPGLAQEHSFYPAHTLMIEDLFCGLLAGADAVRDADAAVAISGEGESGQVLAQAFDAVETFEMPHAVLGHGGIPFVDAGEKRCGAQAQDLLEFAAHDGNDGVVGKVPEVCSVRSGEETAEQGAIVGSAVGKFVVDESGG